MRAGYFVPSALLLGGLVLGVSILGDRKPGPRIPRPGPTSTTLVTGTEESSLLPRRTEIPRLDRIRAEVARDPHQPPATFMDFVESVAQLREDPLQQESLADRLEEAARGSDYPPVQAFSLRIFRDLTRRQPQLEERLTRLESDLPREIIELSNK